MKFLSPTYGQAKEYLEFFSQREAQPHLNPEETPICEAQETQTEIIESESQNQLLSNEQQ